MRASIRWALWGTLALTAWALLASPTRTPPIVAAVATGGSPAGAAVGAPPAGPVRDGLNGVHSPVAEPGPLPERLPAWEIEPARADPFQASRREPRSPAPAPAVPSPPVAAPKPVVAPPPQAVALAAPSPASRFRVLGSMRTPGGERLVLLGVGDIAVTARAGMSLEGGYTVDAVEPRALRLSHAASGAAVVLTVPTPPDEP